MYRFGENIICPSGKILVLPHDQQDPKPCAYLVLPQSIARTSNHEPWAFHLSDLSDHFYPTHQGHLAIAINSVSSDQPRNTLTCLGKPHRT